MPGTPGTSLERCDQCGTPKALGHGYCITCGRKFTAKQLVTIGTPAPPPPTFVAPSGAASLPADQLPLPPPPPTFDFHHPTEGPPTPEGPISERRGWARAALAIGVGMAVLTGALVFVLARGEQHASGTTLALSFKPGQVYRFHLVNRITGTFSSDGAGLNAPIDVGVDETVAFRVISVDRDGITTAVYSIGEDGKDDGGDGMTARAGANPRHAGMPWLTKDAVFRLDPVAAPPTSRPSLNSLGGTVRPAPPGPEGGS